MHVELGYELLQTRQETPFLDFVNLSVVSVDVYVRFNSHGLPSGKPELPELLPNAKPLNL